MRSTADGLNLDTALALDEPDGLVGMERTFRQRPHAEDRGGSAAEALCAQLVDLRARLTLTGLTPDMLLDDVEPASEWLRNKAHKRIWLDGPHRTTAAMRRTPRRMQRPALRGNWETGEGSPTPHVLRLWTCVDGGYYDEDGTARVLWMVDTEMEALLVMAPSEPQRRGIRRALLTVLLAGGREGLESTVGGRAATAGGRADDGAKRTEAEPQDGVPIVAEGACCCVLTGASVS